jgi:hypothetical protein
MNDSSYYASCSKFDSNEDNHEHGRSRDCLWQWQDTLYNHSGMKFERIGLIASRKKLDWNGSFRAKAVDFPSNRTITLITA